MNDLAWALLGLYPWIVFIGMIYASWAEFKKETEGMTDEEVKMWIEVKKYRSIPL